VVCFLVFETFVKFCKKFFEVVAVNHNSLLYSFVMSESATEAMHAYRLQNFGAVGVKFKAIHN